jgi:XTP/dITP diphosphohydrolase
MHRIVFATNNAHKMGEVSAILNTNFQLISLKEIGCFDDIPETQETIEGNAVQKARYVWDKYGMDCIADDTGLEVEALNGAPGVFSARYAGDECIAENNIQKLLKELQGVENRKARFKTVAALILDGQVHLFEGIINGRILTEKGEPMGSDMILFSFPTNVPKVSQKCLPSKKIPSATGQWPFRLLLNS